MLDGEPGSIKDHKGIEIEFITHRSWKSFHSIP